MGKPDKPFQDWALNAKGTTIAWTNLGPTVSLLELDTKKTSELAVPSCDAQFVSFLPPNDELVLTCFGNPWRMVRVDREGHVTVLRESASEAMFSPLVSPDGKHVAFGKAQNDSDVWMVDDFLPSAR